ncbi:MAG: tRNA-dihydrouridine synthase family protein [Salinivirgaceae bacterium]|jgi:tRNA-dihydrouridine synthase B|nr:tRNA-dihydrouridine synthase family protein [Salinivirgaceae bacterium]
MAKFLQLAPMQAMTDIHFMNTYHKIFGGFTEMMAPYLMAASNSRMKVQNLQKYFSELNSEITLIPQLLSNDAQGFLHYANVLHDMGFQKVNWNLGCPFPYVTKKQRGSGLLPFPDRIEDILEQVMPHLGSSLSIKIRLGLHHPDEILPIIDILNKFDIEETIIHPRTAAQKYEGTANKGFFKEIYPKFNMPIIYNGDIINKAKVDEMEADFDGIKGYMIGRGAFINPFITNQINNISHSDEEKIKLFSDFYYELHNYYKAKTITDHGFLGRMKDLWFYFAQSFEKGDSYLFALKTINEIPIFETAVSNILASGKLKRTSIVSKE